MCLRTRANTAPVRRHTGTAFALLLALCQHKIRGLNVIHLQILTTNHCYTEVLTHQKKSSWMFHSKLCQIKILARRVEWGGWLRSNVGAHWKACYKVCFKRLNQRARPIQDSMSGSLFHSHWCADWFSHGISAMHGCSLKASQPFSSKLEEKSFGLRLIGTIQPWFSPVNQHATLCTSE